MIVNFKNIATNSEVCFNNSCDANCENHLCKFCETCLEARDLNVLHKSYLEHIRRGEFMRIFPSTVNPEDSYIEPLSPANQFLKEWIQRKCEDDEDWC